MRVYTGSVLLMMMMTSDLLGQQPLRPTPSHEFDDPFVLRRTNATLTGDWNGDGIVDLVFLNGGGGPAPIPNPQVVLGLGAWHFREVPCSLPEATAGAVADLDGDGDQDLALVTSSGLLLQRNVNNGAFTASFQQPTAYSGTTCVVVGDIDGDGDIDIVTGHNGQNRLYRNNGTGGFVEGTQGGLPYFQDTTVAMLLVDVDGDQDLDLVTGNHQQQSRLAINDGTGSFTDVTAASMPQWSFPLSDLACGDIDGDGDVDLVFGLPWATPTGNRLYLNDGTGHFTDATSPTLAATSGPALALFDADGDQDLDLFIGGNQTLHHLLLNNGAGIFTDATTSIPSLLSRAKDVATADLDGDGRNDVIIAAWTWIDGWDPHGRNRLLKGVSGGFEEIVPWPAEPWGGMLPRGSYDATALALLDHDQDGDLDLVIGTDAQGQDRLYQNDGNGVFTEVTATALPQSASDTRAIAAGDVNNDGHDDLVFADASGRGRLYLGTLGGGLTDASSLLPNLGNTALDVALGDLDGDGDLDIYLVCQGQHRVYANDGAGAFSDFTSFALPPVTLTGSQVQLVDLDNDGDLDVLLSARHPASFRRLDNNGAGIFAIGTLPAIFSTDEAHAIAADFDGDGDNDIFFSLDASWRLARNHGNGTFTYPSAGVWAPTANCRKVGDLAVADLDGDGDLDVVAVERMLSGPNYGMGGYFLNDGTGQFTDHAFSVKGNHQAMVVGDVDGDDDEDIVVAARPWVSGYGVYFGQTRMYMNTTRHVVSAGAVRIGRTQTVSTYATGPAPNLLTFTFFSPWLLPTPMPVAPIGDVRIDPNGAIALSFGLTPSGTPFSTTFTIPNAAAFVGFELHFQGIVEGRDAAGAPTMRVTNATRETIRL